MPMRPDPAPPALKVDKAELKERLEPMQYHVTQEKGTERPFSNKYYHHYESGTYTCLVCEEELFDSDTKYHSGSGWPSFYDVIDEKKIKTQADASGIGPNLLRIVANPNLIRTEVCCKNCGSHLGHVFKDGPKPTGLRYCVNSSSLSFREASTSLDSTTDGSGSDEPDSGASTSKKKEILSHPATIDGCGSDGICTLGSRMKAVSLGDKDPRKSPTSVKLEKERSPEGAMKKAVS